MEIVRYRPGEAIRWLQTGAAKHRKDAQTRSRSIVRPEAEARPFAQNLKSAATALMDFGKGAYAELLHHQAEASEYVLQEDHVDILSGTSIKAVAYDRVRSIRLKGDKAIFQLDKGSFSVKPFAHIVAGRTRIPIGWVRNGTEVPFELMVEELAARCGIEVEEAP